MPNRVRNKLKVMGDKEHMKEFLDKAIKWKDDTPSWRLSSTIPGSEDIVDGSPRYNNYDWLITNLGTKWDAWTGPVGEAEIITLNEVCFEVRFETAWTPPYIWIEKMIGLYPNLNFKIFCTEEMLNFTEVIYNNEEGLPDIEFGVYISTADNGRPMYLCVQQGWLYIDTNEPVDFTNDVSVLSVGSSLKNYIAWFELDQPNSSVS